MGTESNIFASVATFFTHGGIWMWPIFIAQVASLAIIAERVINLFIRRAPNQKDLAATFERDIRKGDLDRVLSRAQESSGSSALAAVVQAGTQAAMNMGGREEIQSKMDEILLVEHSRIERRTEFLAMIGNVATLLGLLGTIVGMIRSFASLSSASAVEKAGMLASGISEAMNATAYGLIVAIPALVAFAILQNRANTLLEDLNQGALKVFNLLGFHYDTIPVKRK